MKNVIKKGKKETIYRIFLGDKKLFESSDKESITKELSRLNIEAVKMTNEKNIPVEDRNKYDLRIYRDEKETDIKIYFV